MYLRSAPPIRSIPPPRFALKSKKLKASGAIFKLALNAQKTLKTKPMVPFSQILRSSPWNQNVRCCCKTSQKKQMFYDGFFVKVLFKNVFFKNHPIQVSKVGCSGMMRYHTDSLAILQDKVFNSRGRRNTLLVLIAKGI